MQNKFYKLQVNRDMVLTYELPNGNTQRLNGPAFEINEMLCRKITDTQLVSEKKIGKFLKEERYEGNLNEHKIALIIRGATGSPFIRYRFELFSEKTARLTKATGKDNLEYARISCNDFHGIEVRVSEYNHQLYSFCLSEVPAFRDEDSIMGPILVQESEDGCALLAYEHGSGYPDKFIEFAKETNGILLRAVKGNYYHGQPLNPAFETVWLQFGAIDGTADDIAALYRDFQLNWILPEHPSRKPLIYYNTWNDQERTQLATGTYHQCMTLKHILEDIDIAHEMGIDVYVIDTGWFTKCGDWEVRTDRFPDALESVSAKLEKFGMKLGLWINPPAVALSSPILAAHRECIASVMGELTKPGDVWESEKSHGMCLASEYWKVLADTLIRLCKSKNVSYLKWDAIWQYGCTDGNHLHGTDKNSYQERGECYSFNMDRYLAKICDAILEACPDVILDFDITEEGRNVGLSWLSHGKYFLVNNGPNYHNYDLSDPQWTNIFVNPGPARTWICRPANNYDKWIPSHLFLCHYFPDPPKSSQRMNLGSLILGGNGVWGDLHALSQEDIAIHKTILAAYKKVADDMIKANIKIDGTTATTLQKYEKINKENGRGAIVLFGFCSRKNTLTVKISQNCTENFEIYGDAVIEKKNDGFYIRATFEGADAVIIYCL